VKIQVQVAYRRKAAGKGRTAGGSGMKPESRPRQNVNGRQAGTGRDPAGRNQNPGRNGTQADPPTRGRTQNERW